MSKAIPAYIYGQQKLEKEKEDERVRESDSSSEDKRD